MAFNVQENAVFIPEFSKNLPTMVPPSTPSPRSVASLPRFGLLLTNPGYTTVTDSETFFPQRHLRWQFLATD